jgi:hypothetical protein
VTRRKTAAKTKPLPANDAANDSDTDGELTGAELDDTEWEAAEQRRTGADAPTPARLSNTEKMARQRQVFGAGDEGELRAAVAHATRVPRRRIITAELVKAETALVRLERRRQDSLAHAETVWAGKRVALIKSFPRDVLAALDAMNVLDGDELEAIGALGEED